MSTFHAVGGGLRAPAGAAGSHVSRSRRTCASRVRCEAAPAVVATLSVEPKKPAQAHAPPATSTLPVNKQLASLAAQVDALIAECLEAEHHYLDELKQVHPSMIDSARNLAHYLALRRADRRELQNALQTWGLSSLGSCESHVVPTLTAVAGALSALRGGPAPAHAAPLAAGYDTLESNAILTLGPSPRAHRTRVCVTSPPEASDDPTVLAGFVTGGMNILRVNCAHDGAPNWRKMVAHLRAAEAVAEVALRAAHGAHADAPPRVLLQFDLAGPKLRTGAIRPAPALVRWKPNTLASVLFVCDHTLERSPKAHSPPPEPPHVSEPEAGDSTPMPTGGPTVPLVGPEGAAFLAHALVGDTISTKDALGRSRHCVVTAIGRGWAVASCDKSGSVGTGSSLKLKRRKKADATKGDAVAHALVAALPPSPGALLLSAGDVICFTLGQGVGAPPDQPGEPFRLSIELPEVFAAVKPGHRILLDDGKFEGVVVDTAGTRFTARLSRASGGTAKLAGEKGINLPESLLALPAVTPDDEADLASVLPLRPDLVALSFVQRPEDISHMHSLLDASPGFADTGVLLKIETAAAFRALPKLLFAAMRRPRLAVMVARGDLGVEVGFARLSEVQEEVLWLCEAARVPVMWATQVLDSMARTGAPSRAEVTDAASANKAEAVMLNKGPYIKEVLALLSSVLSRMDEHERKKMHLLRKLSIA